MPTTHPSPAELSDFLLGKLPDAECDSVEAHLADCPGCLERAAADSPPDTLVELLAAANTRLDRDRPAPADLSTPIGETFTRTHADSSPHGRPAAVVPPPELANHPKYRVLRPLGYGGMGVVWLAEHLVMGRQVALKVMRAESVAKPEAVERFRREVRAAAKLTHENIATAYDAEQVGDRLVLVMEYVPGEPLADIVRHGPLPADEACRAVRDAARGLAHAHAAGLVHRDVKPSNLIRTPDGITKVLDFGLVVAVERDGESLTGGGVVMGTPDYIAPEQADNPRAADARSDVYALGCTLYHLLAGRVPYPDESVLRKVNAHRDPAVQPAPLVEVQADLAAVVAKMMAKAPADRYQSATEVAAEVEIWASGGRQPPGSEIHQGANAPRSPNRHPPARRWLIAAGLLFAAVALAAVVYTVKRDNEQLTITTDDPDIEVVMKRNGELVRIVDAKTKQAWELDTKKLRLKPDGGELTIDLPEKGPLVIRRNGDVAVSVERKPPVPPAKAPEQPKLPAVEELHRIPFVFAGWHDFAADGKEFMAFTSKDGKRQAVFFDTVTGKETGRFPVPAGTDVRVWFLPGSQDLLVSVDHKVSRWNRTTGKKIQDLMTLPLASEDGTFMMPLVAEGGVLCAAAWGVYGPGRHGVLVYDLKTGKERFRVKQLHEQTLLGMSPRLSPDGKLLTTTDTTTSISTIRVWDTTTGDRIQLIEVSGFLTTAIEFSRDSHEVIAWYVGGREGFLGAWDVGTGKRQSKSTPPVKGGSHFMLYGPPWTYSDPGAHADEQSGSFYILPGGDLFVLQAGDVKSTRFCDTRTGGALGEYRPGEMIRSSVASADGRYVLVVTDSDLRVIRTPNTDPKKK